MPVELQTMFLAMTPVNELRGTIPIALSLFNLPWFSAFFWAVLGNMIPVFFLLWFWRKGALFLAKKFKFIDKFFNWLFTRKSKKFYSQYKTLGDAALVLIVAIPLPFTGAWTGTIIASIFGIEYKKALGLIFAGVLIAGIIVTLLSTGVISIIGNRL